MEFRSPMTNLDACAQILTTAELSVTKICARLPTGDSAWPETVRVLYRTFPLIVRILVCPGELSTLSRIPALASLGTLGTEQRVFLQASIAASLERWCPHFKVARNVFVPKSTRDPTANSSLVYRPLSAVEETGVRVQQEATALTVPKTTATRYQ